MNDTLKQHLDALKEHWTQYIVTDDDFFKNNVIETLALLIKENEILTEKIKQLENNKTTTT